MGFSNPKTSMARESESEPTTSASASARSKSSSSSSSSSSSASGLVTASRSDFPTSSLDEVQRAREMISVISGGPTTSTSTSTDLAGSRSMRLCAMWALAHASRARDCALALPLIDECRAIVQQRDDAAAAQKRTGGGTASSTTTTDVEEAVPSVESLGYLQAMALLGMGDAAAAHRVLAPVVQSNPNHEMSAHLLTLVEQRVATAAVVSLGIVGAAAAVGAVVLGALASGRNARA